PSNITNLHSFPTRRSSDLGRGDHSWEEVEKRIRIFQPERRETKAAHFSVIAMSLLKRTRLWIRHYNRDKDRETEREISPQRLVQDRKSTRLNSSHVAISYA